RKCLAWLSGGPAAAPPGSRCAPRWTSARSRRDLLRTCRGWALVFSCQADFTLESFGKSDASNAVASSPRRAFFFDVVIVPISRSALVHATRSARSCLIGGSAPVLVGDGGSAAWLTPRCRRL